MKNSPVAIDLRLSDDELTQLSKIWSPSMKGRIDSTQLLMKMILTQRANIIALQTLLEVLAKTVADMAEEM